MAHIQERGASILSIVDPEGPLDAALLLRQTGILVAGWTRDAVPQEVLTVMAATMFASVQTIAETLGDASPSSILVETESRRLFATKFGTDELILVAPKSATEGFLRQVARRIVRKESQRASAEPRSRASIVVKE
ncbi:MAG TPA: roadblock/LC7 domain-containing protein [Thermoplasmata archaeon]|nr:roadblock/LC7 domain-containing protein [Thermoplasmata archaeon]